MLDGETTDDSLRESELQFRSIFEKIGETGIRLELAAVIPERELWLYKNPDAKSLLEIGLEQSKSKQFSSSPPDLDADQALADQLED